MDFEEIKNNLIHAVSQLMALRVVATSPREKVVDLPAMYAILCALMAPWAVIILTFAALLLNYRIRFEKDVMR